MLPDMQAACISSLSLIASNLDTQLTLDEQLSTQAAMSTTEPLSWLADNHYGGPPFALSASIPKVATESSLDVCVARQKTQKKR